MGLSPDQMNATCKGVTYDDSKRVVDMTEVLPNLFIGDEGAAKNAFYLKKIRVTHVLNAAQGSGHGFVETDENFYKSFGIKYKGLKLADTVQTNISMYFTKVADYIDQALEQDGGECPNFAIGNQGEEAHPPEKFACLVT